MSESGPRMHPAWRVFGAAVGAALLVALVRGVGGEWDEVRSAWSDADPAMATVAIGLLVLAEIGFGVSSARTLRAMGTDVPLAQGVAAFLVAQTAKHVPGGIWPAVARAGIARRWGLDARRTVTWFMLEHGLSTGAGLAIGATGLGMALALTTTDDLNARLPVVAWWFVAGAGLLSPLALHRRSPVRGIAVRIAGPLPDPRELQQPAMAYLVTWMLTTASSVFLAAALLPGDVGASGWVLAGSAAGVASIVGFLVLPVPAGLGVREAVFVWLAHDLASGAVLLSFAVGMRIVATVVQTILAACALPVLSKRALDG